MPVVRWLPAGPHALLLELPSAAAVTRLYDALGRDPREPGQLAGDVVPAARTLLFEDVTDLARLREVVTQVAGAAEPAESVGDADEPALGRAEPAGEVVEVPVRYDGADLDEVARLWDMTRAEVVATHTGTDFTVAFCGFAPGFAYCTGLPQRLHVPRRDSPRARVPAGSVGLAGEFTGVYPSASPGGWQLLGSTDLTLWDLGADPPALLSPGTRVRFTEVS